MTTKGDYSKTRDTLIALCLDCLRQLIPRPSFGLDLLLIEGPLFVGPKAQQEAVVTPGKGAFGGGFRIEPIELDAADEG